MLKNLRLGGEHVKTLTLQEVRKALLGGKNFPYFHPLACFKPGESLVEVLLVVPRSELDRLLQKLSVAFLPKLESVQFMKHPLKKDHFILHLFLREDTVRDLENIASGFPSVKFQRFSSSAMKQGWGISRVFFPIVLDGLRILGLIGPLFLESYLKFRCKAHHLADVFLYQLGFNYGVELAKHILEILKLSPETLSLNDVVTLVEFFSDYARIMGFGIIEPVNMDPENLRITFNLHNCWEAELYLNKYGRADREVCLFTRGNIAGVASYVLKREMCATEKQCLAKGAPYCVVVLSPFEGKPLQVIL